MKEIKIQVARDENFTPASLMKRYADQTGTEFRRSFWGAAELVIEGRFYQHHHWGITAENDVETVTLYLEEVKHNG